MRINNIKKKVITLILTLTMIATMVPTTVFAAERDGLINKVSDFFSNLFVEPVEAGPFTVLEIRKGSLNGEKVVDLLNPTSNWKLEKESDYYLYGEFTNKKEKDTLEICFGDNESNTYNGVTFFNPPGGTYKEGNITHDYFDELVSYTEFENPGYGKGNNTLKLQDGKLKYHIKDSIADNVTVNFAMGMILKDGAIGSSTEILDGITVSVGDENLTKESTDSVSSNIKTTVKKSIGTFFNTTTRNAALGSRGERVTVSIGEKKSTCTSEYLYDTISFEIVYPKNALVKVGFDQNLNSTTNQNYGTISEGSTRVDGDNKITKYTITDGYKSKSGALNIIYALTFPKEHFSDGDKLKTTVQNVEIILKDGEKYNGIKQTDSKITYTILDTSRDYSMLSGVNRNIYNQNISGTNDYIVNMGAANTRNGSSQSATPYEKTFEAKYNITNTAAKITHITVPCALVNEDAKKPVVTLMGKDSTGKEITKTITDIEKYKNSSKWSNSGYMLFEASEFGMENFIGVKADIGILRKGYSSSSSSWKLEGGIGGAFGHFTTDEVGIQVKNTYRLYNTNPAYRNNQNGDLVASSIATSQGEARVAVNSDGAINIKDDKNAIIDSIEAGDSVQITGGIVPNARPNIGNEAGVIGNTAVIYKPVFYLTLPQGIGYEYVKFKDINNKTLEHQIENISYKNITEDGVSIYKITFKDDILLGYYKGDRSYNKIQYEVKLNTSKSLLTKRYELNDLIGFSAETPIRALSNDSNSLNTTVKDKYGINGGLNYSGIAKGTKTSQPGFGLQQLAEVNVYNSVSVSKVGDQIVEPWWHTYEPSNPNSIVTIGANSVGQFKLTIENTSSTEAKGLKIAIPIPKKDTTLGSLFMDNNSGFDMTMKIPDNTYGFNISYVTLQPMNESGEFITVDSTEEAANAILLEAEIVAPKSEYDIIFDFTVQDGIANAKNIWRNAFSYETLDGKVQNKTGSYVASTVAPGKIFGKAFNDKNGNKIQDAGEVGIPDVTIVTKDSTGKISSTKTDKDGNYEFIAVREDDIELTATVEEDTLYRFRKDDKLETSRNETLKVESETKGDIILSEYKEVKYFANGGIGNIPNNKEYLSGDNASIAVKPDNLLKQGYVFKEWNTKADGTGVGYQPGESFTINNNTNLYAIWDIGVYNIYFNYRGANSGNEVTEKILMHREKYGEKEKLPTPSKIGYDFVGWTNSATGNNVNISNSTMFATGEDTTLYAIWKEKTDLTVRYDSNGGIGTEESKTTSWEESILPTSNPSKEGYNFIGWTYEGNIVTEKDTFKSIIGEEIEPTLIATWEAKGGYSVIYDLNGGNGEIVNLDNISWDTKGLLPATNPIQANKIFAGWKSGEKEVVNDSTYSSLATNENNREIVIVAQWDDIKNNIVSYNSNGGTTYSDKNNVENDESELIPEIDPIKKGYKFNGWYYNEERVTSDTVYSSLSSSNSITLEARWIAKEYEISYNVGDYEAVMREWNDKIVIPSIAPTKPGSEFLGWTFNGIDILESHTIASLIPNDNTNSIVLNAKWENTEYIIEYDSNGGSYISPKSVTYEENKIIPETNPRRIGYKFVEWKSGNKVIDNTSTYADLIDGTMTAQWIAKTGYTVEYNTNGGNSISNKVNVSWTNNNLLPTEEPIRAGYTFIGWTVGRDSINSNTVYGDVASVDTEGSKITLVAQWAVGTYTVKYNTDGGTIISPKKVSWDSTNLIPVEIPVKEGHSFLEWQYNGIVVSDDTSYSYLVNSSEKENKNELILTAIYKQLDSTVGNGDGEEDSEGDGAGTDVQGKIDEGILTGAYKIDIKWGAMKFDFNTDRVWNPETHEYERGTQGVWNQNGFNGINNKISIENHSNGDLEMDFAVIKEGEAVDEEDQGAYDGVDMHIFTENIGQGQPASGMILSKVQEEGGVAPTENIYFRLNGEPNNLSLLSNSKYTKMATIIATFRPVGSDFTPRTSN